MRKLRPLWRWIVSVHYRLTGDILWHTHLAKDGWVERRYNLEKSRWEYRIPKIEDVVEAEYMWAIK